MPGSKEIRTKIKSVQNTRKITKAMEMVAASKMRKAQERMRHARPYGDKIRTIAAHLAHANPEYRHPFLVKREGVKDVGMIVVTLAGSATPLRIPVQLDVTAETDVIRAQPDLIPDLAATTNRTNRTKTWGFGWPGNVEQA